MTAPVPHLDDLTWDGMTTAIRSRIPAESDGRWTLHAPVDPGVTLLELFAYLLEQQLYRLDQVPDELVVAVLRLLDVAPPQPARPASTVLAMTAPDPTRVPAGTAVSRDPLRRLVFTLDDEVAVLPVDPAGLVLWVDGRDRAADLRAGRGVPVLAADGGPAEFRVELPVRPGTPRPPRGTWLSLLVELDAPDNSPPSWSPGAVPGVPEPAALDWSWYPPATPSTVDDGTGGLRRSGVVRLRLPDAWGDGGAGDPPVAYGLRVSTRAATYASAPVLRQIVPNAGPARHLRTLTADGADQVAGWLRLPGQTLTPPDAAGLLLSTELTITRGAEEQPWEPVPDFAFAGPGDRVYVLDRDAGAVRFGDGLTGAVPVPDGPDAVALRYTLGGGTAGNGGRTANWSLLADGLEAVTAANPVPVAGGQDPESLDAARLRAGDELRTVTRAVTAADFAELAAGTPGVAVARSTVDIGAHPAYPGTEVPGAVTVRVLPLVPPAGAVQPDPGLLRAVRAHLERARLIGTELFICPPRYRRTELAVRLASRPGDPAAANAALRSALATYLDPLAGGDDGAGFPFGGPLRPSALLRVALAAVGDAADVTAVAIGLDGAPPDRDCADVPLRAGELPDLRQVTVRIGGTG